MKRAIIVLGLAVFNFFAHAQDAIGVFDLRYTLETNLKTKSGLNTAWDDAHAVAALQGIVNRGAPRLYVHFVMLDDTDVDAYWWDKYSREGQWLHGKKTKEFKTIEELVSAYAKFLKGVVVYDCNVASTSAVASAVAGIEDLLPLRFQPLLCHMGGYAVDCILYGCIFALRSGDKHVGQYLDAFGSRSGKFLHDFAVLLHRWCGELCQTIGNDGFDRALTLIERCGRNVRSEKQGERT